MNTSTGGVFNQSTRGKRWHAIIGNRSCLLREGINPEDVAKRHPDWKLILAKAPGQKALERMVSNGIAKTPDGCRVEPDGTCPHGFPSWVILLGYI